MVTDHESRVLARRTFRRRAWELGAALDWAAGHAAAAGCAGLTVAVEPTGHRWLVVGQLAAERGLAFVCVQPLMSSWARRAEDLTFDKTDDKDAVLIAPLAAQRRPTFTEVVRSNCRCEVSGQTESWLCINRNKRQRPHFGTTGRPRAPVDRQVEMFPGIAAAAAVAPAW